MVDMVVVADVATGGGGSSGCGIGGSTVEAVTDAEAVVDLALADMLAVADAVAAVAVEAVWWKKWWQWCSGGCTAEAVVAEAAGSGPGSSRCVSSSSGHGGGTAEVAWGRLALVVAWS